VKNTIDLDFETYSESDITVAGSFRYSEDPSTEVLITGYSIDGADPIGVDMTRPDAFEKLVPLFDAVKRGYRIVAHNATFERNIWENVSRFPVTPKPDQWDCTAARARFLSLPGSLDGAAAALKLEVRKDSRGQDLINLFSKPGKKGRVFPKDNPSAFREFIDYCRQDVRVEMQLDAILPPLPPVEKKAFLVDFKINETGIPVNVGAMERAIDFVAEVSETLTKRASEIAGCRPTQREKTLAFLESRGFKLPNLQASTVEALAQTPDLPPDIHELLHSRIEVSRAGTKKLIAIKDRISEDGRVRGAFLYSAASTRRWSSRGVQLHNLQKPRKGLDADKIVDLMGQGKFAEMMEYSKTPLTDIAQSIRYFFETSQTFGVVDYASVEPRGEAWLAGEQWILDAYHAGQDLYKLMASRVFGVAVEAVSPDQRFLGKQLVLGAGYGMGPDRFVGSCADNGADVTLAQAKKAIYGYRESVPAIVKFWRESEACSIKAVKYWVTVKYGKLIFRPGTLSNGMKFLFVDMPSGTLAYANPHIGKETWNGQTRDTFRFYTTLGSSFVSTDCFGGLLVENYTQALTRDILRDGLIALDDAGFKIPGHVHDEGIVEGDLTEADLEHQAHLMCNSSPWATGFPIKSEGYLSKRYRK